MSRLSPAVSGSLKPLLLTGALAGTLLVAACGQKPGCASAAACCAGYGRYGDTRRHSADSVVQR